jgi:Na+-driven multidrug efflux pump
LSPQALKALFTRSSADPGRERYRRAGLTASTSYIAKALTMLMGIASVPLTVHYLGPERYGVWLTISSLLVWVALTDFGLAGNALVNVLSEAVGNDDRESARHYAASAFWALVTIALVIGVVFTVAFHSIPWRAVFRVSDATSSQELETTCALVLTLFVVNLPLSLLQSLYSAHQDGYLANIWGIASGLVSLLGLVVVTRFHGGLPQLVLAISGVPAFALGEYVLCVPPPLSLACACALGRQMDLHPAPAEVGWQIHDHAAGRIGNLPKPGNDYHANPRPVAGRHLVVTYKVVTLPVDLAYMGSAPFLSAFGEASPRRSRSPRSP